MWTLDEQKVLLTSESCLPPLGSNRHTPNQLLVFLVFNMKSPSLFSKYVFKDTALIGRSDAEITDVRATMPMSDTCLSHANSCRKRYWRPAAKKRPYFRPRDQSEAELTKLQFPGKLRALKTTEQLPARVALPWRRWAGCRRKARNPGPLAFASTAFPASVEESAPSGTRPGLTPRVLEWLVPLL